MISNALEFSGANQAKTILKNLLIYFFICTVVVADDRIIEIAQSPDHQWNGIALTKNNRMFASFPPSAGDVTLSVAEILDHNVLSPFPGGEWNTFNPTTSSQNVENRFVNINAILTDSHDNLWVVDNGMIGNETVANAAKLVKIDLRTNTVERIYSVSSLNPPQGFALNDVRIGSRHAFRTESGLGSVVIIDLQTGQVRRVLDNHLSTKFVDPTVVRMEGRAALDEKGQPKRMHNNHLKLTPDEKTLFY